MTGASELHYWREGDREVDFVTNAGRRLTAIEVKD
jgi:predicted AAA+ superfamily ATPase